MKVVFASNNPGKVRELQALLERYHLEIIPQENLGVKDIPETGLTFIENALLKARNACEVTGLPAIADDSGLEVTALNGAPGIYSARYAGEKANAQDNIKKLLNDMSLIPNENRTAAFHCVLVYLAHAHDPTPIICHGIWQGTLLKEPTGQDGFGYDPIFFVPTENCSAAQLPLDKKNNLSHRGQALRLLMQEFAKRK